MAAVFRRRSLGASVALVGAALVLAGCQEVPSNLVKSQPYELEPIPGTDLQRVRLDDSIAENIDLQTATVTAGKGGTTVVPHAALIYNPEGLVFVYTKPEPRTYVRAAVKVRSAGDRTILSDGPPVGTVVVTVGAAELLATEYEILNQHP